MMTYITRLQRAYVHSVRPLHGVRGIGRLSRLVNRGFLKAGVPPIQTGRMRDGTRMRTDLRSQTEWYAFYSGRYDDGVIALIQRLLSRCGGNFLDVGGNIGMYAVRVGAGLETGQRSLCFEPMPENAKRIRENARLNNLQDMVEVIEVALSDVDGETDLILREDFEMGSATGNASVAISEDADKQFRKIRVPTRRFDDLLAERGGGAFSLVKIDIEGHEDFFLRGAAEWLHRERPIIITEINNSYYRWRGTTSSDVFQAALPSDYQSALLRTKNTRSYTEPLPVCEFADLKRLSTCILYPKEKHELLCKSSS